MSQRKDRLIQARVPEKLETTLKDEARRRRTTVSQMIRSVLEDTFQLVDDVVTNVDQLVSDSVELAHRVGRRGRASGELSAGDRAPCGDPRPDAAERLAPVQAWNELVLNQPVECARCGSELPRGRRAYLGVCDDPKRGQVWLCTQAVEALANEPENGDET